jgi:hypothetical protein
MPVREHANIMQPVRKSYCCNLPDLLSHDNLIHKRPSGLVIVVVYVLVVVMLRATIAAAKRATAGVSGKSQRLRQAEIAALVVAIATVPSVYLKSWPASRG